MSATGVMPFVVGQWVRGERFYGRTAPLESLLDPALAGAWLVGARRIGKTSLLRQLELLAPERGMWPLVWDLQGAADAAGLEESLDEALDDAGERLPAGLAGRGWALLDGLAAALTARGQRLLLLVDEAEELLAIGRASHGALAPVAAAFAAAAVRLVSSVRLLDGARALPEVSALLAPLGTPEILGPLAGEEAGALLAQAQRPADLRPPLSPADRAAIREAAGDHPYLLQLLAKRTLEIGSAAQACAQVAADRMLAHLVAVDLALLAPAEREALRAAARGDRIEGGVGRLIRLGFLRLTADGTIALGAPVTRRALEEAQR